MNKLTSAVVKSLALVGAFQIYKEYTSPETSDRTVTSALDNAKTTVRNFTDRSAS